MKKNSIKYFFVSILFIILFFNLINGRLIDNPQITLITNIGIVLAALFFIGLRFSKRTKKTKK